jgi:hypothetical protein
MERAARLFKNKRVSGDLIGLEDLLRAAWPTAVGKIVAAHTGRLRLVRSTLLVEVEDAIWQKQLFSLSGQIVRRLKQVTGACEIENVEFRIGVPRRQAQRAERRDSKSSPQPNEGVPDEAEAIRDPVLKKVYRISRKKATA